MVSPPIWTSFFFMVATMEILRGELFVPYGKFDHNTMTSLMKELNRKELDKYNQVVFRRNNGFCIRMQYLSEHEVLLNPLPDMYRDWMTPKLKARVLISIDPDMEYVMGVAGKQLKRKLIYDDKLQDSIVSYWIIEKFIRMEFDDFSYRINKHEIVMCDQLGQYNFCFLSKRLYESNWTGYPKNVVLNKMVKRIEGELIARGTH